MIKIAIDGTAASGKGTLAKNLSKKYNYPHLDTGLLYRKVAHDIIIHDKTNSKKLEENCCFYANDLEFSELKNTNLRNERIASLASKVARFSKVRKILNKKQKDFINLNKKRYRGCILDGRDIGTNILPNADFKFFITASLEIRAKRRLLEKNLSFLQENEEECMLQSLINDMHERDTSDSNRLMSPLVPAKDAHIIDTSLINADQLLLIAINIIEKKK